MANDIFNDESTDSRKTGIVYIDYTFGDLQRNGISYLSVRDTGMRTGHTPQLAYVHKTRFFAQLLDGSRGGLTVWLLWQHRL